MDDEIQENPTPEGASIQERLESYLAAEDGEPQQQTPAAEPEAETPVETEGDEPEQSDEPQLALTDLAKYLGVEDDLLDADEAGELFIKTKIDGQEGRAKFQDVLKAYQLQGHIDNKAREVAEQQKAVAAQFEQQQQAIQQRIQYVEDVANVAHQSLLAEYNNIDWAEMARSDPAEYVAKQHEFNARQAQIGQALQYVQHERTQHQQQSTEQYRNYIAAEAQKLPQLIPEWKSEETAKKEMGELKEWGQKIGLSKEEVGSVSNSVHVLIMRKAMLYDKLQQAKPNLENKVRTAPKLVKAGQPEAVARGEKAVRDLKTTIRKSGGKAGVMDYLLATGKV